MVATLGPRSFTDAVLVDGLILTLCPVLCRLLFRTLYNTLHRSAHMDQTDSERYRKRMQRWNQSHSRANRVPVCADNPALEPSTASVVSWPLCTLTHTLDFLLMLTCWIQVTEWILCMDAALTSYFTALLQQPNNSWRDWELWKENHVLFEHEAVKCQILRDNTVVIGVNICHEGMTAISSGLWCVLQLRCWSTTTQDWSAHCRGYIHTAGELDQIFVILSGYSWSCCWKTAELEVSLLHFHVDKCHSCSIGLLGQIWS